MMPTREPQLGIDISGQIITSHSHSLARDDPTNIRICRWALDLMCWLAKYRAGLAKAMRAALDAMHKGAATIRRVCEEVIP